ncbi:MAG: hypothetical protein WC829_00440 [Hyphomicrobium sp.]|jgi:hypothetical protein
MHDLGNHFFFLFLSTVGVIRAFLYIRPVPGPTVFGVRLHHYSFGLVAVAVGLSLNSLPFFAIGLGLVADELTYLAMGGHTHEDNYSRASLAGTALVVVAVFLTRQFLVRAVI